MALLDGDQAAPRSCQGESVAHSGREAAARRWAAGALRWLVAAILVLGLLPRVAAAARPEPTAGQAASHGVPRPVVEGGASRLEGLGDDEGQGIRATPSRVRPGGESAHLAAGNALLAAGKLPDAIREFAAAARLAPHPAPILDGLARLYLDPRVHRPADALDAARAARRLEPWREQSYYLEARAHESLGDQEAARRAYRRVLANFPRGSSRLMAEQGLGRLSRSTYEVTLAFSFENLGSGKAENVRLRVQSAEDFLPYSQARLRELPPGARGRQLDDGTRYLSFEPFTLEAGERRTLRIQYLVSIAAGAYEAAGGPGGADGPEHYLAPSPFIESEAPEIVSLGRTLAPDPGPSGERARRLYDFVLKRLTYAVQPETQGALGALEHPTQADCTEFAALFIALARATGIPARPVFGYLYEDGKSRYEISHLWAQFWGDGAGWVSADPTNGSLEPDRYFGRVESSYVPLWVPHPWFGDLAGVRVSYRSAGEGDVLFTELITEIRRVPASEFDVAGRGEVAFDAPRGGDSDGPGSGLPFVPAAALVAAAMGLRFWQRRGRPL